MGQGKARNKKVHMEVVLGVQANPGESPVLSNTHSSSSPRMKRFRVPWPNSITSLIQLSGSRVWIRASRARPPAPWGIKRPWAPDNINNHTL